MPAGTEWVKEGPWAVSLGVTGPIVSWTRSSRDNVAAPRASRGTPSRAAQLHALRFRHS